MSRLEHDSQGFLTGVVEPTIRRANETLQAIRADVAAIKKAFQSSSTPNLTRQIEQRSNDALEPATPRGRSGNAGVSRANTTAPAAQPRTRHQQPQAAAQRDIHGRFTSNGLDHQSRTQQRHLLGGVADRLARVVASAPSGMEQADPNIRALNEVAQPLARGYQFFMGGDKESRWYRRIFGELRLFRRDQTVFNRAEQRTLREIDENTENQGGGGSGGGGHSFMGGLLGGGISGIATRLLPMLGGLLSVAFGPIGIAVAAAATAAWGLFTDDGRKFFANAADSFAVGWKDIKTRVAAKWDEGVKVFNDLWAPIGKFFADKFGIVSDTVKTAVAKVAETANTANNFVRDVTGVDVKEGVTKAARVSSDVFTRSKDWVLGQTSKLFESGKAGVAAVSSGKGDKGGASYGTYQLSSKEGTLQQFLETSGYGKQFEGLKPGSHRFNAKWREIARTDKVFGAAQHEFIKNTHFDPQAERLKRAGIDISGRGKAVQDAVWSTSVQFGGNTGLIENALKGKDLSKLSDAEFISALQDYKARNNDRLFKNSSAAVRVGTLKRALAEKNQLLGLALNETRMPTIAAIPAQAASIPSPVLPAMPRPQAIAEQPPLVTPMVSDFMRKGLSVSVDKGDVGQNLSDRTIAHIVMGGIGGV